MCFRLLCVSSAVQSEKNFNIIKVHGTTIKKGENMVSNDSLCGLPVIKMWCVEVC
jgi:hypothetical protein